MKYSEKSFNSAVEGYKKLVGNVKGKDFFIKFDLSNKNAFYSIAPLSRALHDLGADLSCTGINKTSESLEAVKDVWAAFEDMEKGVKSENTAALKEFIEEVDKKAKGEFRKLFKKPDLILEAKENKFTGDLELPFHTEWFKDYRMEELMQTSDILWRDVYALKRNERVGIGFSLIPKESLIGHPLEDYLDSYSIIWAMAQASAKTADPTMNSSTFRGSMLEKSERVSELRATLLGCELEKEIDEEPFVKYKKLSSLLRLNRIKPIDLSFSISAKGYPGKHLFGELIGYPSANKKTRWIRRSDTDVREKINKDYLRMTGIKAGNMGNIPGGEAFVTPEYIKGIFVGDVVVHVDQSYKLSEKNPLVVECFGDSYRIKDGPGEKIKKRKRESMKSLLKSEKNKSLPQGIIDLKKKNFERIGEFAINTNPKARLCEYL